MTDNNTTTVTPDSVFDQSSENQTTTKTETTQQTTETKEEGTKLPNSVLEYVGEGKKYKDLEALVAAMQAKEEFIETLKSENKELRSTNTKESAEETFKKLTSNNTNKESTNSQLSKDEIAKLVKEVITQDEQDRTSQSNINTVESKLVELKGAEGAVKFLKDKSVELGLSVEYIRSIASKSPTAFYDLVKLDNNTKPQSTGIEKSTTSIDPAKAGNFKEGTKEYFDNIRRTNRSLYNSPKFQQELMKAAVNGTYKGV